MQQYIYIGLGGALGAIARYAIGIWLQDTLPWGTWVANLLGCFILGFVLSCSSSWNENWRLLAMVGFCGAFTTFSTFSKENLHFLQEGNWEFFLLYGLGSMFLGILFVLAGNRIGSFL